MTNSTWLLIIIVLIALALGSGWYLTSQSASSPSPTPTPVTPTPTPATTTPAQATYKNATADLIVVDTPKPGETVSKTFTVSGKARGNWYFEANFPIEVLSATGTRLVQSPVQASGEWMTADFVPFTVQVTIPSSYQGPAMLVLRNDNASGLPEHDRSISIPIVVR